MAFLIPDNLGSRKDVPEAIRRVARAFAVAFEDDATVWYEPLFDPGGRHPHLVVLEPRIGIVVLEVLKGKDRSPLLDPTGCGVVATDRDGEGGRPGRDGEREGGEGEPGRGGERHDPLARAATLAATLRESLDGHPSLSHVPVGAAAAFSGVDRAGAERLGQGDLVDLDACLFKPDIDAAIGEGEGRRLLQVFTRAAGSVLDEELTEPQLAALRGVIHPDVVIGQPARPEVRPDARPAGRPVARSAGAPGERAVVRPAVPGQPDARPASIDAPAVTAERPAAPTVTVAGTAAPTTPRSPVSLFIPGTGGPDDEIKVLDRRQEAFAKSLGSGHRVIRGVAGSGKTLVLVHRARLLARRHPGRKILVTCYTRSLASLLRAQLADLPDVDVVHLDRLMARVIRAVGDRHPGYGDGGALVAPAALDALRKAGGPRYRAVMVDEAQDFDTAALQFCVELLDPSEPDEQDLVVVADSAQNVFRKNFHWKDAGIRAQGRTRVLRVNYRNTREILEFAHAFLVADPAIAVDELPDAEDELSIIPAESAERRGPHPTVTIAADAAGEVRAVVGAVARQYSPGMPARSIAVLHGDQQRQGSYLPRRIVDALGAASIPAFWVTDPRQRDNRSLAGSTDAPVVVSTIQSAKGLEFPHVVVCGLGARDGDLTTARKLLYVGFTRAVEQLTVVVAADSPFRSDVERATPRA